MITSELLLILLNEERNEQDRLESLLKLQDYLDQEDVITSLATLAKKEKSTEIRLALLTIIVKVEITNLKNKEGFLKILFHFSAMEKEEKLRLIAVNRLSDLAFQDNRIELLLAENLLHDTSEAVQVVCLSGLQKTGCKNGTTIDKLSLYAHKVTSYTAALFIELLEKLPLEQSERIIVSLLHPLNHVSLKALAIQKLRTYTSLQDATIQHVIAILLEDHSDDNLEQSILNLLGSRAMQDLSIVDTVIGNLQTDPESKDKLLWLLKRLSDASPNIVDKVKDLYKSTNSFSLKAAILRSLNETDALDMAEESLSDLSSYVRYQGLHYCAKNMGKDTQRIVQAMLRSIQNNADINLRRSIAIEISKVGYLDGVSQEMLLAYYSVEENPWVLEQLTKTLFLVPLRDDNKEVLLKAYIKTLHEAFFTEDLKNHVIDQLGGFQINNSSNAHTPELVQCLVSLMLQEVNIGNVKKLYDQYNKLESKDDEHIELVLLLFERFVHFYPTEPLNAWANELKHKIAGNKLVGEKADFLAKITGDNTFLTKKGALHTASSLVESIIASIRKSEYVIANGILQDAYRNRKIKKEEIVLLYKRLLQGFDKTGLIYNVLEILREQHLMTAEIVEISLDFINSYPNQYLTADLQYLLGSMGKNMPDYAQHLESRMTPQNYASFSSRTYNFHNNYDLQWNSTWRNIYANWTIGKLWSDLYPKISLLKFFNTQSGFGSMENQNLDYYILRELSRIPIKKEEIVGEQTISGEEVLLSIGNRMNQLRPNDASGSLYDRMLYVFTSQWERFTSLKIQPSAELGQCATKGYYVLYKRWKAYPDRVSHELLKMPLWIDFNLISELLKEDSTTFKEFFDPYYELIKTEAKHKVQNNRSPNREQPPQYRTMPAFHFSSITNYVTNATDFIITAKWPDDKNESQLLKESLTLIAKVWKTEVGDLVMKRLQLTAEGKRNEMLEQL